MLDSTEKERRMNAMRDELAALFSAEQTLCLRGGRAWNKCKMLKEYLLEMDKALIDLKPLHKNEATVAPKSVIAAYSRL